MPKDKFNPIAELPILPGVNIADDEAVTNAIDSTYPPIEPPKKFLDGSQKEPVELVEKEPEKHLAVVRLIILICLIILVLFGIFLTLNFMPNVINNVSNIGKSFTTLFVSNKTTSGAATSTSTQTPASTQPIAASTQGVTITSTTTDQSAPTQQTIASQPIATAQPKTSANLVATLMSTNAIGNRETVVFRVQNIGGKTSGAWSFIATLPSSMTPSYQSVTQAPLAPKSGVIYTLGFDATTDLPVVIDVSQNGSSYQYQYQTPPVD